MENLDFLGRIITVRSDVDGDKATHDTSPETTIIDGNQSGCVVVFKNGETSDTGLEGFTIRNGNHGNYDWGGGINCLNNSSPTISNNIIAGNTSDNNGGGMLNSYSSPTVIHCTFKINSASKKGGGIYNNCDGLTVTHCTFYGNTANWYGGGMYNNGSPTVSACLFIENSAVINGGGMFNAGDFSCSPIITNCIFSRNTTDGSGGGMCNYNYSCNPVVANCTFSQNVASIEGGGICNYDSLPTVTNCILWNDTPEEIYNDSTSSAVVTYSCVQNGYAGAGNIDADPLLVDPDNGDFHLTWLSPCINRGTNDGAPSKDIDDDPRPYMGTVDMGADEFVGIHPLAADTFSVPETGCTVNFSLKADSGNRKYLIVGGVSGTAPGTSLPGGYETLRVNWDWFSNLEMTLLNTYIFSNFASTLDAQGMGTAQLNLPSVPGAAGITMHYAYCCNNPFDFVSNPVAIEIVP